MKNLIFRILLSLGICAFLTISRLHAQTNLALNKPAVASSATGNVPNNAFDGNFSTRWESQSSDPQWIYVDLGFSYSVTRVKLIWEAAYGKDYLIQVSEDAQNWVTVRSVNGNTALTNDLTGLHASGRYVRMYGTARGSGYGYSLYEMEVFGPTDPPTVALTAPLNNTSYSTTGLVTLSAMAAANGGKTLTKVEFYTGTSLLGTDYSSPYTFSWAEMNEGTYTLTARATDNAGAVTISTPVTVIINNLSTGACSGAQVWDSLTVYANAGMQITYLGRLYENRWYTTRQNPVRHSGQYEVWKLVSTCGTGTVVNVTLPDSMDTYTALASINIHVDAITNDNYRITGVKVYNGSTLINSDSTASFSFDWNDVPAGNYSITAEATDNLGVITRSAAVPVYVVAGTGCNAPQWRATTVYSSAGEQVTYQGALYRNNYYTQNQDPALNSGQYQVWTKISDCPTATTLTLTSPSNNASYIAPATITVKATAAGGTISAVEFYEGLAVLGVDSTAPYSYNWSGVGAGSYTLSAKAYNGAVAVAVSSAATVMVVPQLRTFTWTGGAGTNNWNTADNWSPAGIPGTNDSVIIANASNFPRLASNTTITDLTINSDSLDLNNQQLTVTGRLNFAGGIINNGVLNLQCSTVTFSGTTFGIGTNINAVCSNIYLDGSVFNGSVSLTKEGAQSDPNDGAGGCVFNGPLTIANNTNHRLRMGTVNADDFNADVVFNNNNTGALDVSYNSASTFAGDIIVNSNTPVTFGAGAGVIIMDSSEIQTINQPGLAAINFNRFTINKPFNIVDLNAPVSIDAALVLTKGKILTASGSELVINNGTTVSGTSHASFVEGPVTRYGSGAFTFPTGSDTLYRPIAIEPNGSSTDAFTAKYYDVASPYDPEAKVATIDHISGCEYWTLDRTAGTTATTVRLSWDTNSCGVNNPPDLIVARWNGSQWTNLGNGGTTGTNSAGNVISSAAVNSFSPFTLGSVSSNNVLPVELISFTATSKQTRVLLQWHTSMEKDNNEYEVQRSADGRNFTPVAYVQGAMNTIEDHYYSTYDDNPLEGLSYYRLKQKDIDGNFSYSTIVSVYIKPLESSIKLLSNPVFSEAVLQLHFREPLDCEIILTDESGRIVFARHLEEISTATQIIDMSKNPSGFYVLSVKTGNKLLFNTKVIKE